jgi:hypothetical protein
MGLPPDVRRVGWYRFAPHLAMVPARRFLAGHRDSRTQAR